MYVRASEQCGLMEVCPRKLATGLQAEERSLSPKKEKISHATNFFSSM